MGIEKIAGDRAVSYQGSTAVPAAASSAAVGAASLKQTDAVPETINVTTDFTWNADAKEEQKRAEEMATMQNTQLKNAVGDLNKQMKNSEAIFGIHEKTNRVTIKIVDKATKEVIKEYPPEQTLDMIAKVWEIAGILVDEKR